MTPTFKILADGKEITALIAEYLQLIRLRDGRGLEGDTLSIELDDSAAKIKLPPVGAVLKVWLGFEGKTLHYKGQFKVDRLAHSGPPDKIIISAKPADFSSRIKERHTESYNDTTLGAVLRAIATRNGLKPAIAARFDAVKLEHIDQTDESDIHFLTRLAVQFDAVTKPANGALVFTGKGESASASGSALATAVILRSDTTSHNWASSERSKYTGARAYWQDKDKAQRTGEYAGDRESVKTLPGTFATKELAQAAAQAELSKVSRVAGTLDIVCKLGLPELIAETRCTAQGFRTYIDGDYVIEEVTHTLHPKSGLGTNIKLDLPK